MLAKHQGTCRSNKILPLVCVGLFCLTAGLVFGQSRSERASSGTVLYFEAADGTIRFVSVDYGVNHGSLKFKTVTVPRT
jgi:hypothetical protein